MSHKRSRGWVAVGLGMCLSILAACGGGGGGDAAPAAPGGGGNRAPVAGNLQVSTLEDMAVAITLTATDADGDALTYTLASQPGAGTLSGTPPSLTYVPGLHFNGADSFTYIASDGSATSSPATVTLAVAPVNDPPSADDQSRSTPEDTPLAVTLTGSDLEGDALTYFLVTPPAHGTTLLLAGTLTYTPDANYNGTDSFTFQVNDGLLDSTPGTVTITITSQNDAPVLNAFAGALQTNEDTTLFFSLASKGSDVDGDMLSYLVHSQPAQGIVTCVAATGACTYYPSADFNGSVSLQVKVYDGSAYSNILTVDVNIAAVPDAPFALGQSGTLSEDTAHGMTLSATDADGDNLTLSIASDPSHGTLSGTPPSVTYTPDLNYNGTDSFTFTGSDGTLTSNTATVSLTVTAVNDAPTADAGASAGYNGGELAILDASASSDVEGSALSYAWTQTGGANTVTLQRSSSRQPVFTVPNADDTLVFQLIVSDGSLTSTPAAVTITTQTYGGGLATAFTTNPFRITGYENLSAVNDVAVAGNLALVLSESDLQVVDVTDPAAPAMLGSLPLGGIAIAVSGSLAVLGSGATLTVVDLSAPLTPVVRGSVLLPSGIQDLALVGELAYVVDSTSGLQIVAIADPDVPAIVGGLTSLTAYRVAVSGSHAYVVTGASLAVIDVSNPATPELVGSANTSDNALDVALFGSYAYVVDTFRLYVIDITLPFSPNVKSTFRSTDVNLGVAVDEAYVYVAGRDAGLQVYNVASPTSPQPAGAYATLNGRATGVAAGAGYAFVRAGPSGSEVLEVFDVSTAQFPELSSSTSLTEQPNGLTVSGGRTYATSNTGLRIYNSTNSLAPAPIPGGTFTTTGFAQGIEVVGNFAYIADFNGLAILLVSNPSSITQASRTTTPGTVYRLDVEGNRAYLAASSAGLLIYDVTLAGLVPLLGSYDTGGSAQGVAVRKNLAAVADYSSLLLFDVSNPATPTPTGGLGGLTAWGVASTGNLVALAADSQGLKMVDVSDPAAPAVVGTFDTIGRASEVKMMANHALVEDFGYSSGIYIVDISDPTIPRLAGFFTKRAFVAAPYAADGRTIYLGETVYNPNTFVNAYSLRAGAWRPTLLTRYATASAGGANLVYSLSWPETATPTEQDVSCWVTGGTCTVSVVDQTLNTATVTWTPPATADDHEIVIAVGTQHYFISEVDRVSFQ